MFTVLRLEFLESCREHIPTVANELNRAFANTCSGEDKEPLRMSCVVADSQPWDTHLEEIRYRLDHMGPILKRYGEVFANKHIDVLIEPEDWGQGAFEEYSISLSFFQMLIEDGLELTFTVSRP